MKIPNPVTWILKKFKPLLSRWELWEKQGKERPANYESLVARYKSWVYVCAKKNAETVAQTKLRLYVRGSTKRWPTRALETKQLHHVKAVTGLDAEDVHELTAHPLLDLLHSANPYMTGMELMELTLLYLELTGNGFWYKDMNGLGTPSALWPLMSQYTKIVPSEENFVKGYLYGKDSRNMQAFDDDEIIHFRYPNPGDQFYGLGPLEAALIAVNRMDAQSEYQQALWDNNARPDFALKSKYAMGDEQKKRLLEDWYRHYRGPNRAGRPAIVTGELEIEPLGWAPKDTGLILLAKFTREEIADIFGVPMTMLEVSKSRAEAEAGLYAYAAHTINPRLRRFEQVLNERLVPLFDERLFVAFDNPVPESRELELQEIEVLAKHGLVTRNELRDMEGWPQHDLMDEPLIPAGMMLASMAAEPIGGMSPDFLSGRPFRDKTERDGTIEPTRTTAIVDSAEYFPATVL